ncbi:unnamed protein product [Bursaphelenchus xylophilus]|uniref:trimethyllysine dioxygenase n=1 Tax=Bursaphelenchus xylophilus TaxID=6326 RepID=A0A1I7SC50_BURXY|nr:unnamed protein product [Bursaphelenchus xylophilus]CAG9094724.1 unnamed protein product [Bursaphelenchus xylophilus]
MFRSINRLILPQTRSRWCRFYQGRPMTVTPGIDDHVSNVVLIKSADPKFLSIELQMEDTESLRIPLVWLRDHCRSEKFYDYKTNQRKSNVTSLFDQARLSMHKVPFEFDKKHQLLTVRWEDGHESTFNSKELLDWAVFTRKDYDECASRTLWNASTLREIPSVSSQNFDFAVFARLFVRFGVAAVLGVESRNEKATKKLCESIAPYHGTFFGDFWVFGTNEKPNEAAYDKHEDSAYGNAEIGPHNDGTYMDQTPGIQVLHCLRQANEGGENIFVDGFAAAEQLKKERPDLFDVLATTPVEHHYLEGLDSPNFGSDDYFDEDPSTVNEKRKEKLHARSVGKPVLHCFKHKVNQITFNPYDRAPLRTLRVVELDASAAERNVELTVLWYEAYEKLSQIIHNENNALKVKLQPGTVVFFDNTRILHARSGFEGHRKMCGCYLSRDGFLAKARPLLTSDYYKHI